ncbi:MAG: hypothetical protein JWN94_2195 [Betaproteobacteria bacterium]|nr:hypothetical protein [Betaproteobacteria bacterium]
MVSTLLPDPRRYGTGSAAHAVNSPEDATLRREVVNHLARADDAAIVSALEAARDHAAYVKLWRVVTDAANLVDDPGSEAVVARIFALPLVIVTGSRRPASLTGVVPDIAVIGDLFKQHGALGPARNFGLGNALCSLETIEQVRPAEVYAWTRNAGAARRELPPADITIDEPGEHVHLRYIVGAAIAPAAEPSFVETASNIGVWGMPLTRALAAQLSQPDVEVLPLARPPLDLLSAPHAGRYAQLEAALNLFASNAVRKLRSATGDPDAVISAHDDGDIRIGLSSPFDTLTIEGFRWPLHPLDDFASVTASISDLLAACRITNVRWVETVLPALNKHGHMWYPRVRELDPAGRPLPH